MSIVEANEPFATGVKVMIALKKLKQVHIAERAGLSQQELSDMLNGRRLIKARDVLNIADALNTGIDDIYAEGKRHW